MKVIEFICKSMAWANLKFDGDKNLPTFFRCVLIFLLLFFAEHAPALGDLLDHLCYLGRGVSCEYLCSFLFEVSYF